MNPAGAHRRLAPIAGRLGQRLRAYAVHVYTASGVALAFLAALELTRPQPDARYVFLLLFGAVFIDATDGPFARRWEVKRWAASIDGRTIDDLVDYLTFTFLPLLLMARMQWLPEPVWLWIVPALDRVALRLRESGSEGRKRRVLSRVPVLLERRRFLRRLRARADRRLVQRRARHLLLAALTFAPIRFLYPNLAPPRLENARCYSAARFGSRFCS